jgi:metal-sulfur cluster biosynthetic enzyme
MIDPQLYDKIIELLEEVIDPEIGIDIVSLGLIYNIDIHDNKIIIDMTLTYAGCPLTEIIEEDIANAFSEMKQDFIINWVWIPAWNTSMITSSGQEQLSALGFNSY